METTYPLDQRSICCRGLMPLWFFCSSVDGLHEHSTCCQTKHPAITGTNGFPVTEHLPSASSVNKTNLTHTKSIGSFSGALFPTNHMIVVVRMLAAWHGYDAITYSQCVVCTTVINLVVKSSTNLHTAYDRHRRPLCRLPSILIYISALLT